ncbi:hypothetical protein [Rufibacter latericius]|uniref:Uncharacterized protein n=1 Tax=Rufibacter latericius TaxID=2487040 RepID=A0A3M9N2A3_9BACT|nr:hypothetical protein [Rufibacter latericius]RNI31457.1 hypothetical protein EFB08_02750 [Rufibacter latericius]
MKKRRAYTEEAEKLGKAIDIAIEAFKNHVPELWEKHHVEHTISCYKEWKERTLNPEPQFKSLASLKYKINDVFTYFQEGTGLTVEFFWKKLNEAGLDFKRENKLEKILQRDKIKGRIEYEYVTDMIGVAEQTKMMTSEDSKKLSQVIGEFELKKRKK